MSKYIPDGMRCIICYEKARNGVIRHARTCPTYLRAKSKTSTNVRFGDIIRNS